MWCCILRDWGFLASLISLLLFGVCCISWHCIAFHRSLVALGVSYFVDEMDVG